MSAPRGRFGFDFIYLFCALVTNGVIVFVFSGTGRDLLICTSETRPFCVQFCFQVFPVKKRTFLASKLKFTAHWRSPGEKKGKALKFKRTSLERQRGGEDNEAGWGVCPSETWLKSFYILVKYWTLLWKSKKYGLSSNNNDHHSDNNNNSMCSVLWEKLFTHSGQTVELHPTGTKILDLFWS